MRSYEIRINISTLLHYSEVLKPQINNETLLMLMKSFSTYIRKLYLRSIIDEIYSHRYEGEWEPVGEEGYLKFIGTEPKTDIIYLIRDALEVREIKNNIIVRIDPTIKYPGSRQSLIRVLHAIDTGTTKFNARPILKKIVRQIQSNIITLWKSYLKRGGVA